VPLGTVGHVQGFFGGVAADEPQAALAGRDVLTAGGSAADAAATVYFMLSVTMPSAAGLGGGGMCLVRDSNGHRIETLDFLGQPTSGPGNRVMVPGNPRGMFALHAKYGKFEWREIVRPAENLARFGTRVSRAFADELKRSQTVLAGADAGSAPFKDASGNIVAEGSRVVQADLAATLAQIRARGGAVFHMAEPGRRFSQDVQHLGFGMSYRDLNAAKPIWRSAIRVPFVQQTSLYFPMPRTPAGTLGAKMAAMLVANGRFKNADAAERGHLIAEAAQRAMADAANGYLEKSREREINQPRQRPHKETVTHPELTDDYAERLMTGYRPDRLTELATGGRQSHIAQSPGGTTSFTVLDNNGGVVACTVSMNGSFGTGRSVPGTGMFLAPYPDDLAARDLSFAAVIVDQDFGNKLFLAGAASGGTASQAVLTDTALTVSLVPNTIVDREVAARTRVYRDLVGGVTYVENGAPGDLVAGLKQRGHRVLSVPELGRVNMAFCSNGLPAEQSNCRIVSDPRGLGYATVSN